MRVKLSENTKCPKFGRAGDAGYDFFLREDIIIKPRQQIVIDLGVAVEIPPHYAGKLALRSSTCNNNKHLHLKNPLADSNYRGNLHAILYNDSFFKSIKFKKDQRILSLYVFAIYDKPLKVVDSLTQTNRGSNWNGSSNK